MKCWVHSGSVHLASQEATSLRWLSVVRLVVGAHRPPFLGGFVALRCRWWIGGWVCGRSRACWFFNAFPSVLASLLGQHSGFCEGDYETGFRACFSSCCTVPGVASERQQPSSLVGCLILLSRIQDAIECTFSNSGVVLNFVDLEP